MDRREFLRLATAPLALPIVPVVGCRAKEASGAEGRTADARIEAGSATIGEPARRDPRPAAKEEPAAAEAVVATARDPDLARPGRSADGVRALVRKALGAAGDTDAGDLLGRLFDRDERIGIKVNTLAGPGLSTSVDVVEALVGELRAAGRGTNGIYVFDRLSQEMADAGYAIGSAAAERGYRATGTDAWGYSRDIYSSGRVGSLMSNVFLGVDALISVGVVKDHDLAGVGVCVKNLFGVIHNPNRYHANQCDPYLADLLRMDEVRRRLRLAVADGLTAEYHGGPALVRAHTWPLGAVLASTDIVALDAVAADLIEQKRREKGLPTLEEAERPPRWLRTAAGYGLGVADLQSIRRTEV